MTGASWLVLGELDARVLRATDPFRVCTVERVALLVGCEEDVAGSCLRGLCGRMLVEPEWLPSERMAAHLSR